MQGQRPVGRTRAESEVGDVVRGCHSRHTRREAAMRKHGLIPADVVGGVSRTKAAPLDRRETTDDPGKERRNRQRQEAREGERQFIGKFVRLCGWTGKAGSVVIVGRSPVGQTSLRDDGVANVSGASRTGAICRSVFSERKRDGAAPWKRLIGPRRGRTEHFR